MSENANVNTSLEKIAKQMELNASATRVQFDTLAELQKEERLETAKLYAEEKENLRKHYGRIIAGLIITLAVLLGGIIGGAIYLFTNFDFGVVTYQDVVAENSSNSTIYDGITFNTGN